MFAMNAEYMQPNTMQPNTWYTTSTQYPTFMPPINTPSWLFSGQNTLNDVKNMPMNNMSMNNDVPMNNDTGMRKKRNIQEDDFEDDEVEIDVVKKRIRTDFKELDAYTIKLMLETGCILWGKGKRYEKKLFEAWDDETIERYKIEKKYNNKDYLDSLCRERIETIKTEQFFVFAQHYQSLPKELKDIINYAYPDFPVELDRIINQAQDVTYFGVVLLEIWSDLIKD